MAALALAAKVEEWGQLAAGVPEAVAVAGEGGEGQALEVEAQTGGASLAALVGKTVGECTGKVLVGGDLVGTSAWVAAG